MVLINTDSKYWSLLVYSYHLRGKKVYFQRLQGKFALMTKLCFDLDFLLIAGAFKSSKRKRANKFRDDGRHRNVQADSWPLEGRPPAGDAWEYHPAGRSHALPAETEITTPFWTVIWDFTVKALTQSYLLILLLGFSETRCKDEDVRHSLCICV